MTGMIPRKSRERNTYVNYLKKAEKFYENMEGCVKEGNYDAAALAGIHSAISLIDALLIYKEGVVCASMNHEDSVKLLVELIKEPEVGEASKHAVEVLKLKRSVESLDCLTTENQALSIQKHVSRLHSWVKKLLPDDNPPYSVSKKNPNDKIQERPKRAYRKSKISR